MFDYVEWTSIVGDILAIAQGIVSPITFFITGQATTNLPDYTYNYSTGMIFRRTSDQIFILIFGRDGSITTNSYNAGTWSGWKIR